MRARAAGRWGVPAALFAALAALGAAVERGALQGIDRFGYAHLQPLHMGDWSRLAEAASPVAAVALVGLAAVRLRGDARVAAAWAAALVAGAVIELICKPMVEHPVARADEFPWLAHDGFPSGHAMRGIIVAGALSAAWPRARGLLAVWAILNAGLVEVTRMHVPSEVIGGVIAGLALATAVGPVRRRPANLPRRAEVSIDAAGGPQPNRRARSASTDAMPG